MRLTVLGCSGSLPSSTSAASCYLVEAEGYRLLLDLGSGALGPLQSVVDLADVDAVVLSHLHPDHCLDVCGYYVARRYGPPGREGRIPLLGPTGTASRLARAYGMPEQPGMSPVLDVGVLDGRTTQLGPFTVRTARVNHPVETYAIRLEHGGSALAYSGDTGVSAALSELATGADLLLCEATFAEDETNPPDLHLTARQAAEHAARAGVGRLLLTHLPPWRDPQRALAEAQPAFGAVGLARPLDVHEV